MRKKLPSRKPLLSLILAFLLTLTLTTPVHAPPAAPFTDVPSTHWARSAIMEAYADGAVNGTGNNRYDPDGSVTMAQFIAILTRAYCAAWIEAVEEFGFHHMDGEEADAWYAPNYDAAWEHDLFEEVPDESPDVEVTREVMAQILYNLMRFHRDGPDVLKQYSDADLQAIGREKIPDFGSVSSSLREAVAACYSLGVITGIDSTGSFSPQGRMSRAQTAVIYVRLKKVLETGTGLANQTGTSTGTSGETSGAVLTNGKPVTEENVLALTEEYKNGKAPVWEKAIKAGFTSYKDGAEYDAYEPWYQSSALGYSGIECAKFAYAFWDELFGDLPMREFTGHPEEVRPGDLLHFDGHWSIAVGKSFVDSYGDIRALTVDGNPDGKIWWSNDACIIGGDKLIGIYTRYPQ